MGVRDSARWREMSMMRVQGRGGRMGKGKGACPLYWAENTEVGRRWKQEKEDAVCHIMVMRSASKKRVG